tara:strand:+ start:620 stop:856 length:237 start_codon:yes stop_codon:yes gene_type:complete
MEAGEPEVRTLKVAIVPHGEPIFHESVTSIEIVDEAGGEYLKVAQLNDEIEPGVILIDPVQWSILKNTIDDMIDQCRS